MCPTSVEADHYDRWGDPKTTFHTRDKIEGTVDRDTTRQVTLYTTSEHHEHAVYLHVYNRTDRARVFFDKGTNPPPMPKPLHATLNDEPIDIESKKRWDTMEILQGQVFRVWFGEEEWDQRDQMLGSAEITWTPQ